eukprot:706618-Rhodomonas_salina.1
MGDVCGADERTYRGRWSSTTGRTTTENGRKGHATAQVTLQTAPYQPTFAPFECRIGDGFSTWGRAYGAHASIRSQTARRIRASGRMTVSKNALAVPCIRVFARRYARLHVGCAVVTAGEARP